MEAAGRKNIKAVNAHREKVRTLQGRPPPQVHRAARRWAQVQEAWAEYSQAVEERQRDVNAERSGAALRCAARASAPTSHRLSPAARSPVSKDPFLACRLYERETVELRNSERVFTREMSRLFLQLKVDDGVRTHARRPPAPSRMRAHCAHPLARAGRRIDAVKSLLLDFLIAQKALLEHTVKVRAELRG